jgi:hypothetical protein
MKGHAMKIPRLALALAGLAALTLTSSGHTQQLVTDGGFEAGSGFAFDWNSDGSETVTTTSSFVHTGTYGLAYNHSGGTGTLNQSLSTITGDTETVSFWQNQLVAGQPNEVKVSLGGVTLLDMTNLPVAGWTQYTVTTTATSTSETLSFGLRQDGGSSGLDDVSVFQSSPITATPEPGTYAFLGSLALAGAVRLRRKRARK